MAKSGSFHQMLETGVALGVTLQSMYGKLVKNWLKAEKSITRKPLSCFAKPAAKSKSCRNQTVESAVEISFQISSTSSIPIDILTKPGPKPAAILTSSGMPM